MREGEDRPDRTGVGTRSLFGTSIAVDLSSGRVPFLTTKKVSISNVLKELLWMLSGSTDSKKLEEQGVMIWRDNSTKEFLAKRGLDYPEGVLGPIYGYQFRYWGGTYPEEKGIDQFAVLIDGIRKDPYGRRHLISAWNVADLDKMALPPCHLLVQFYVTKNRELDLQVYMRSCDTFLGLPYNLGFYGTLLHMIAHLTNMTGRKLIFAMGDTHIYSNHFDQVEEQMTRTPHPWATLTIKGPVETIDDFTLDNLVVEGYTSWPAIKAPMAV
jgi:thymidylate synthase